MNKVSQIWFFLILGSVQCLSASHVVGSELGFKSLGGSKYQLILKLYIKIKTKKKKPL